MTNKRVIQQEDSEKLMLVILNTGFIIIKLETEKGNSQNYKSEFPSLVMKKCRSMELSM
ncbi:Uncharacterised protein [Mycoplasmoides gallisepticum]|uniref:Uncharacterized protein n=1 Tax=Mycoplasmoides gallisepticum TaxID=2096 RepID=A0A3B0PE38_MYCGL|nr:Uncharacterised protein [Mycoplasmoides gallisepticum]